MAYDEDGYMWRQEPDTYDLVGYQDSVSFSGYESYDPDTYDAYNVSEFHEPKFVDHYDIHDHDYDYDYIHDYADDYDYDYNYDYIHDNDYLYGQNSYSSANTEINYFVYNYTEPELIAYEPVACDTGYVSYHTHYSIANYSEIDSGFNEPEFEEYDPTPYGGGYDIVSVYGKPLPPSDQTCYPRSKPKPVDPKSELGSKPVPNPVPLVHPHPEPKQVPRSKPEPEPVPTTDPLVEPEPVHVRLPVPAETLELREAGEREREQCSYPDYGFDYPWPEYDHGYGIGVGYDYGYGKQVVQVPPCEYNPEVVDMCENIFGNWPCLARIRKQQKGINNNPGTTCPENGYHNPWEECANFIFGRPIASYSQ